MMISTPGSDVLAHHCCSIVCVVVCVVLCQSLVTRQLFLTDVEALSY